MGVLEPITHKEEIEELVNKAQQMYDQAVERMENQKKKTAKSLENLGKQKLESWNGEMNDFLSTFGLFNNIQMTYKMDMNYSFAGMNEEPQQLMINIERASLTANEILKTGALATSAGALIGIASYGGAMMFAHASTGTAIATLHGAAKTNAALAWFGGGSLKAGGLGKLGGKLVLSGIVVAPILIVAGVITAAKSKEKLAEAKKMYAEAENAVAKMNTITTGMEGIEKMSENYRRFLRNMTNMFRPFIDEMKKISKDYEPGPDGKINFDDLADIEQRTLHLAWLMAQLEYHSLSATILTEEGDAAPEGQKMLTQVEHDFTEISAEVTKLNKEKAEIQRLLNEAKSSFSSAKDNYIKLKQQMSDCLATYGQKKIDIYTDAYKSNANKIIGIDDFSASSLLQSGILNVPTKQVNDSILHAIEAAEMYKRDNQTKKSSFIEIAAYGRVKDLSQNTEEQIHDVSLWLGNEMDANQSEQVEFAGVSMMHIENTAAIIQIITGKESLEEAKAINADVISAVNLVNQANKVFEDVIAKVNNLTTCYVKVEKVIKPFIKKIDVIKDAHNNIIEKFEDLSEEEQKVYEFAWNLMSLQNYILQTSILFSENDAKLFNTEEIIATVERELKYLKKQSFKMNGVYTMAADVIWKPYAVKSMIANFLSIGIMMAMGLFQIINGNWYGLAGVAGTVVSMPIFFYFKNLPQSKLFMWRGIRLILGIVLFLMIQSFGMR